MTHEQIEQKFGPLDFGIVLLAEALHVLEAAEHPLVSSYVQLALDLAQEESGRRAREMTAI